MFIVWVHLFVAAVAAASVEFAGVEACGNADIANVARQFDDGGGNADVSTLVAVVAGPNGRSLLPMELYTMARHLVSDNAAESVVTVDCRLATNVGFAFAAFTPGMDCGQRAVAEAMDSVDALVAQDEQTVKLEHLLRRHVPAWLRDRRCAMWTSEWPRATATAFWLVAASIVYAICMRPALAAGAGRLGTARTRGTRAAGQTGRQ